MTTKWARAKFCEEFAPHPGGTNDNDTRNFSKKYQQIFLLDAIFFEQ